MPMAPQVPGGLGYHHHVVRSGFDRTVAAWTQIPLAGCVRLNGNHLFLGRCHPASTAQAIAAAVKASAKATMTTSSVALSCRRKGLKPIRRW